MPRGRFLGIAILILPISARGAEPTAEWPLFSTPEYCCERLAQGVSLVSGSVLWGHVRPDTDVIGGPEESWIWRWKAGDANGLRYPDSSVKCRIGGSAGPGIDLLRDCPWKKAALRLAGFGEGGDVPSTKLFAGSGDRSILLVRDPFTKISWSFLVEGEGARKWKDVEGEGPWYEVETGSDRLVESKRALPGLRGRPDLRKSRSGRLLAATYEGGLYWCRPPESAPGDCVLLDTSSGFSQGSGKAPPWVDGNAPSGPPRWRPVADTLASSPETVWARFAGGVLHLLVVDVETGERCGMWEVSDRIGESWLGFPLRLPSGEILAIGRRPTKDGEEILGFDWLSINGPRPGIARHVVLEDGIRASER